MAQRRHASSRSRARPGAAWSALDAGDRRVLAAFASHLGVLREREELARQTEAARELEAGNRTRTALLAAVSHDLRTPLAGIRSAAETLRAHADDLDPADRDALLDAVVQSTARLTTMVSDLLDMSRLQTGAVQPALVEVPLDEVVDARPAASTAGAGEGRPPCPPLGASPGLLERVLANLLANALRHSDVRRGHRQPSGHAGHPARGRPGTGRPAADASPDVRALPAARRPPAGDGVGLGLAVARGLTEAQGGSLLVEDAPGGGLVMVLDLAGRSAVRVLLVDDDATLRQTLAIGLRAEGHEVLVAADGRSALQAVTEDQPDLVVLDLGLPDLSGVEVLRRLRGLQPAAGGGALGARRVRRQGRGARPRGGRLRDQAVRRRRAARPDPGRGPAGRFRPPGRRAGALTIDVPAAG